MSGTKVTATDLTSGEVESTTVRDNHVLITDGRAYLSSVVAYANGTQVLTVKQAETADEARRQPTNVTRHFGRSALGRAS